MKLSAPRIHPLEESDWDARQRKLLEPIKGKEPFYNVMGTLCRHADAAEKFQVWAYHIMGETSTPVTTGRAKKNQMIWTSTGVLRKTSTYSIAG